MTRLVLLIFLGFTSLVVACDAGRPIDPFDLEGPQGRVAAPGPWTVAVLTDGRSPRLSYSQGEAPFDTVSLVDVGGGQYVGALPARMPGESFRYFVELAGYSLPMGGATSARRVQVVSEVPMESDEGFPCRLDFLTPDETNVIRTNADDAAPQAGLQQTFVLATNLADGHPVRLRIGPKRYASQVGAGFVAFIEVTVPDGNTDVVVDAQHGQYECDATLRMTYNAE